MDKLVDLNFTDNENNPFVSPTEIMREELPIVAIAASYRNKLALNYRLNVKLKDKGLNIKLLSGNEERSPRLLSLWNGRKPKIKPKIIVISK